MKSILICSTLVALVTAIPTKGNNWKDWSPSSGSPFHFTSTFNVVATPDQVVNGTTSTPGEPGAVGYFNFGLNSDLNVICYNITLEGVTGDYQSPALTATHIHEAVKGASGPPRMAFPNPMPISEDPNVVRTSVGCLTGPFVTGLTNSETGLDQGAGFEVKEIEDNPAGFMTDSHTTKYVPGVVRGQIG